MEKQEILRTENLKKYFRVKGGHTLKAVDGISLTLSKGESLGLVGESGCGKSTLGRTIIRIYDPTMSVPRERNEGAHAAIKRAKSGPRKDLVPGVPQTAVASRSDLCYD